MLFHKHNWVEIARAHAPGFVGDFRMENADLHFIERMKLGVTTIIWECSVCKKIRKEEMLGKIVGKVEK